MRAQLSEIYGNMSMSREHNTKANDISRFGDAERRRTATFLSVCHISNW